MLAALGLVLVIGFIAGFFVREFILKKYRDIAEEEEATISWWKGERASFHEPTSVRERFKDAETVDDVLTK